MYLSLPFDLFYGGGLTLKAFCRHMVTIATGRVGLFCGYKVRQFNARVTTDHGGRGPLFIRYFVARFVRENFFILNGVSQVKRRVQRASINWYFRL